MHGVQKVSKQAFVYITQLRKAWGDVKLANMNIAQAGAAFSDDNRWDEYHKKVHCLFAYGCLNFILMLRWRYY